MFSVLLIAVVIGYVFTAITTTLRDFADVVKTDRDDIKIAILTEHALTANQLGGVLVGYGAFSIVMFVFGSTVGLGCLAVGFATALMGAVVSHLMVAYLTTSF